MLRSIWDGLVAIGRGIASINIFPPPLQDDPRIREILDRTDEEAIRQDWEQVGQDMWKVIHDREQNGG